MDTNKQSYYVKVGTGEVLPDKTISEWEFEIKASDEEVMQLEAMFDEADKDSFGGFLRAHTPTPDSAEESRHNYDNDLSNVYQKLHELGTDETRHHIEAMGIIDKKQ